MFAQRATRPANARLQRSARCCVPQLNRNNVGWTTHLGFEFRIRVDGATSEQLEVLVQALPECTGRANSHGAYELRSSQREAGMPDAEVRVRDGELYYCDYVAPATATREDLEARLRSDFGGVVTSEWE